MVPGNSSFVGLGMIGGVLSAEDDRPLQQAIASGVGIGFLPSKMLGRVAKPGSRWYGSRGEVTFIGGATTAPNLIPETRTYFDKDRHPSGPIFVDWTAMVKVAGHILGPPLIKKVVAGARIYDERNEKIFLAEDTAASRWGDVGPDDIEEHQKPLEGNNAGVSLTYAKAFLQGRLAEISTQRVSVG